MRLSIRMVSGFVAATLLLAACGTDGDDSGQAETHDGSGAIVASVAVKDDVFEPEEIRVVAGQQVTWTWEGKNPHNVRSDDFASKIQTDGSFSFTFEDPGTLDYNCTVHPSMTGSIVVAEN